MILLLAMEFFDTAMAISKEQLVIDSELINIVKRINRGIIISEDSIGFETIKKVGQGGQFMSEDHTVKWCRLEHYYPDLSVRAAPGNTDKTMVEKAHEKVMEIIKSYKPNVQNMAISMIKDYVKEQLI